MAEDKEKEKKSLEEVLKNVQNWTLINEISKDPTKPDNFSWYETYLAGQIEDGKLEPQNAQSILERARRDTMYLRDTLEGKTVLAEVEEKGKKKKIQKHEDGFVDIERKATIKSVSESLDSIISQMNEDELNGVALSLPEGQKYVKILEAVKNGDYDTVRKAYGERDKNSAWQKYVSTADGEFLSMHAKRYAAGEQQEFIRKNLMEKGEDGKLKYSDKKARAYVLGQLNKLRDKEKDEAYLGLGLAYAQKVAQEDAEKSKGK